MHRRLLGKLGKLKLPSVTKLKARPAWPEEPLDAGIDANAGFFPARLGTVLHSSYTVVRKLGFGQHSSVWMAKDSRSQCWVAIKVLTAHATLMQGSVACELPIMQLIAKAQDHSDTETHLIKFKDTFNVQSCHGEHLCLVTEVLGSSFKAYLRASGGKVPISVAKDITHQLLIAVRNLHALGIVHTDIKFDNMLAVIDDIESFLSHQANSSRPEIEMLDVSAFPVPPVISQPLSTARDLSDNCSIPIFKLTDFGTSAFVDGYHADIIQPVALRAPEVVIGCGWDTKADIWSIGCLVFEMLTGNWLFNPRPVGSWSADAYHLANIVPICQEIFELTWASQGSRFKDLFTDNGKLRLALSNPRSLSDILAVYSIYDEQLVSFLHTALRVHPGDRASADDLLQHKWLADTK